MVNNDILVQTRPASWEGEPAREGTPLGNGKTGALLTGGVGEEQIFFSRADLWCGAERREIPDTAAVFREAREAILHNDWVKGNRLVYDTLTAAGYRGEPGTPLPLGCLTLSFDTEVLFARYRRRLNMARGEAEITYTQGSRHTVRRCFVSRNDDVFYYEFCSDRPTAVRLTFGFFEDGTPACAAAKAGPAKGGTTVYQNGTAVYTVKNGEAEYGASVRVFGAVTTADPTGLSFTADRFTLAVRCVSGKGSTDRMPSLSPFDYGAARAAHTRLHRRLYRSADLRLADGQDTSNEQLLAEAYDTEASPELMEKIWRFGRYLFISGTDADSALPFPLYGLWPIGYYPMWSQHVANENVEILHWHALAGGLSELIPPLIRYYTASMAEYRLAAERVFGCRGIFVGIYTSPANARLATFVPVILHFTGVGGWLSQHFYRYYRATGDRQMLEQNIFPFMLAVADFYLDYLTYDENGKAVICPSVSPENTPANLMDLPQENPMGHPNPAVRNATIEVAIYKELFGELSELIRETGEHTEYLPRLKAALEALPAYAVNTDGAICEWIDDALTDNYAHRHLSHLYPVFPGHEITPEHPLFGAFCRAVDLRELGKQSGWSLAHMASVYAALGRGEDAATCFDTLMKGCTLPNFFTLHNDYRSMGVTLTWEHPPVQLDALLGAVNGVQQMLFDARENRIALLPALPKRLPCGQVRGFCFDGGKADFTWNTAKKRMDVTLRFSKAGTYTVVLPPFCTVRKVTGADTAQNGSSLTVTAKRGSVLSVVCR